MKESLIGQHANGIRVFVINLDITLKISRFVYDPHGRRSPFEFGDYREFFEFPVALQHVLQGEEIPLTRGEKIILLEFLDFRLLM